VDAQAPRRVSGDARIQGVEQAVRLAQAQRRRQFQRRPQRSRIGVDGARSAAPVSADSACSGSGAGTIGAEYRTGALDNSDYKA
jgi:hypothetical protein